MKMTCTGKGTVGMERRHTGSCLEVESAEPEDALKEEGGQRVEGIMDGIQVSSGARPWASLPPSSFHFRPVSAAPETFVTTSAPKLSLCQGDPRGQDFASVSFPPGGDRA